MKNMEINGFTLKIIEKKLKEEDKLFKYGLKSFIYKVEKNGDIFIQIDTNKWYIKRNEKVYINDILSLNRSRNCINCYHCINCINCINCNWCQNIKNIKNGYEKGLPDYCKRVYKI